MVFDYVQRPGPSHEHPFLNLLIRKNDVAVLDQEPDDDGIVISLEDSPWERDSNDQRSSEPEPTVEGSPELQAALRKLILEFKDIFSTKLTKDPAKMDPFVLNV